MEAAPSKSVRAGHYLQPSYFSSSLYVNAVREDISNLVGAFHQAYSKETTRSAFSVFQDVWCLEGWVWLMFRTTEERARERFLTVTCRLFTERMVKTEALFTRAVALFGLYTLFYTQPVSTIPTLYTLKHIPIPIDIYQSVILLPGSLATAEQVSLRYATAHIVTKMIDDDVFLMLPRQGLRAEKPTVLPRVVVSHDTTIVEKRQAGRPTKRQRGLRVKSAVEKLEGISKSSEQPGIPETAYLQDKADALAGADAEALASARREVLARLMETALAAGDGRQPSREWIESAEVAVQCR